MAGIANWQQSASFYIVQSRGRKRRAGERVGDGENQYRTVEHAGKVDIVVGPQEVSQPSAKAREREREKAH